MQVEWGTVRFDPKIHYAKIVRWWLAYGLKPLPLPLLPEVGFVSGDGVAAGFLYQTDSKLALIENLITDPESEKMERSQALDLVVQSILNEAWKRGFTQVTGTTKVKAIETRALHHGFTIQPEPMTIVVRKKRPGEVGI